MKTLMKAVWFLCTLIPLGYADKKVSDKESVGVVEGRAQRTGGVFNHGNNNNGGGGGSVSTGYGPPDTGYGAPAGGSGYGAGGGGGGYGQQPVYYYQQAPSNNDNGLGGLAALLPIAGLALLLPLGLAALATFFPTITTVGRKKRDTYDELYGGNSTKARQVATLHNLIDQFGLGETSLLQKDMIATYLECSDPGQAVPSLTGCIERLACIYNDKSFVMGQSEGEVVSMILSSLLDNEFLTPEYRTRLQRAGQMGHGSPGSCHQFLCHHKLLQETPIRITRTKKRKIHKKNFWKKINY